MTARNALRNCLRIARGCTRKTAWYLHGPLALLLPASILLAGQSRVEKSFRAVPNCRIKILSPTPGSVLVRGWDKSEVHAVCLTSSPKVEIDSDPTPANTEAEKVDFVTYVLDRSASPEETKADYELDVPRDSSLVINTSQGNVTVERVTGDDWIESVNGAIAVSDGAGLIQVRSLNGNIDLLRPTGHVEAYSIMGNLTITGSESQKINAQTSQGKIAFDGDFLPIGDYLLKTYAGDITVTCPNSDSFTLEARSLRGKLDNQFKLSRKPHLPFALGGESAFGNNNRGDASVSLKSFSGSIRVRPRQ
jgi:DUF4097 and DUF4098 domain-containing protein YvlB